MCTLPLILISGVLLNPCNIEELKPRVTKYPEKTVEECIVTYKTGNGCGSDATTYKRIDKPCQYIIDEINNEKMRYKNVVD